MNSHNGCIFSLLTDISGELSIGDTMTYLVGHLDQLWGSANRSTWDNAPGFRDGRGLNDYNIKLWIGSVFGIKALRSYEYSPFRVYWGIHT